MVVGSSSKLVTLEKLLAARVASTSSPFCSIAEALAEIRSRSKVFLEANDKKPNTKQRFQRFVTQELTRQLEAQPPTVKQQKTRGGKAASQARARFDPPEGGRLHGKWGENGRSTTKWNLGKENAKDARVLEATKQWRSVGTKTEKEKMEAASTTFDKHQITLSYNTARSRSRTNVVSTTRGPKPLLASAEGVLAEHALEVGELGWTFTKEEVMVVMDDLVDGTPAAAEFLSMEMEIEWKSASMDGKVLTGEKWHQLFMQRHRHKLREGTIDYRHGLRKEWTSVGNYSDWHHAIGKLLVRIGFCYPNPHHDDNEPERHVSLPESHPLALWRPGKTGRVFMFDETRCYLKVLCHFCPTHFFMFLSRSFCDTPLLHTPLSPHTPQTPSIVRPFRCKFCAVCAFGFVVVLEVANLKWCGPSRPAVLPCRALPVALSPCSENLYSLCLQTDEDMGNHQTNDAVHAAGAAPAGDAFKTGNRFTGVLGGRLSGECLTPGMILQGKNVSRITQSGHDYFGGNHNEMFPGIKGGACWFATDKGGMEDETPRSFIEAVVMPCVKDDPPTQANPIVLLLDGHKARFGVVVLGWCRANHVIMFLGVPNSTHVWQFSDSSALNGGFKVFWSSAKVRHLMELPHARACTCIMSCHVTPCKFELASPVGGPHSVRGVVGTAVTCNHRKTGVYNAKQWVLVYSVFFLIKQGPI
jgi:hypothetical protein